MPTFRVQLPDGRIARIDAASGDAALAFAKTMKPKVQQDAERRVKNTPDQIRALASGATLGAADQLDALGAGAETGIHNLFNKVTGKPSVGYGMGEAYDAVLKANHASERDYRKTNPVSSAGLEIGGGLLTPMGALGKFVKGGAEAGLLGRAARGAAAGGLLGGVAGGLSADPGKVGQGIKSGATIGAATGGVLPVAGQAVGAVGKGAARLANRATGGKLLDPAQEAGTRIAEALRKDGLNPDQIKTAMNAWLKTGASSPALLDLAGPNTQRLLRAAAGKGGPANTAAVKYNDEIAGNLQDRAVARTRQLTPDARSVPQVQAEVAQRIAQNSRPPQVAAGQAGAQVSAKLNAGFDAANGRVNDAYSLAREAAPEAAHLPQAEAPQLAANIRDAIRDYHPDNIPRVAREVGKLDTLSTPTARDLFDLRSRLSPLSRSADPVEAGAAGRAVRALDSQIDDAASRGAFSGDPEVVGLWKKAIAERKLFGQTYQGGDAVQALTERGPYGGARTTVVAPEDASNAILGRSGVSNRSDMSRDLGRLRDQLGADSPEWQRLQQEGRGRILSQDAGTEQFGDGWMQFARDNPEIAAHLMDAQSAGGLNANRAAISGAVADRGALEAGTGIMNAPADQFAADLGAAGGRQDLSRLGGARSIQDAIERPAEGATGVLNRLATSKRMGRNLSAAYGAEPAADYQSAIGNEVDRLRNARFIDPGNGSQTALRVEDSGLVDVPHPSPAGLAFFALTKVLQGLTLTDEERHALVQLGTSGAGDALDKIDFSRIAPQSQRALPLAGILAERAQ